MPGALSYISSYSAANVVTTFDAGNFVVPSAGLLIVVAFCSGSNNKAINSVTVGGTAASIVDATPSTDNYAAAIAALEVSAGTYDVTVGMTGSSGTAAAQSVFAYLLTGYASPTPTDHSHSGHISGTSDSVTFTIPATGVAVYGIRANGTASLTWSNATSDANVSPRGDAHAVAHLNSTPGTTGHVETVFWGGSQSAVMIGASWQFGTSGIVKGQTIIIH